MQNIVSTLIALAMGLNALGLHRYIHLLDHPDSHTCLVIVDQHEVDHCEDDGHHHHSHDRDKDSDQQGGDKPHHHDCSLCNQPHGFVEESLTYQFYPPIIPSYLPAWDKCSPKKPILEQDVPPIIA